MTNNETVRIYVTNLSDYNAGRLHGEWIDVIDVDQVNDAIRAMLETSKEYISEEYAIHDYEAPIAIREYDTIERVCEISDAAENYGFDVVSAADRCDIPLESIEDAYIGEYESLAEYAENYMLDTGAHIPDSLAPYIDYEAMGRDMGYDGQINMDTTRTRSGGFHCFNSDW